MFPFNNRPMRLIHITSCEIPSWANMKQWKGSKTALLPADSSSSCWTFRLIKVQFLGSCSGQFWIRGSYLNIIRKFPLLRASAFSLWIRRRMSCLAPHSSIFRTTFKWSRILSINVWDVSETRSIEAVACLLSQLKELWRTSAIIVAATLHQQAGWRHTGATKYVPGCWAPSTVPF